MALNMDAIGKKIGPMKKDYIWKDVVLYAIGVGAGARVVAIAPDAKTVYVATFSKTNKVYALDGLTGSKKWEFLTGDPRELPLGRR